MFRPPQSPSVGSDQRSHWGESVTRPMQPLVGIENVQTCVLVPLSAVT